MRRYRQRVNDHVLIAPVAVSDLMMDYLVKLGWLKNHDAVDRSKVGEAIGIGLAESAAADRDGKTANFP